VEGRPRSYSLLSTNFTYSWAPQTYEKLRNWVPEGDPILQKAFLGDYLPAVQFIRDSGVPTAKRFDGIMTIGGNFNDDNSEKTNPDIL
jgi:hypothetical protein